MKKITSILVILLFLSISLIQAANIDYKATAFNMYINGKMPQWEILINKISKDPEWQNHDCQLETLTYYYGLVGHLLDKKRKDDAERVLANALALANQMYKQTPNDALLLGLMANLIGYQIALSPIKAATLAKGMMSKAKKSISLNPDNPYVNILYSNILFYMPSMFGGDKDKALAGYQKALKYMESHDGYIKNNWMYIQLLTTIGLVEEKNENYTEAKKMYQKVLQLQPNYGHVKNIVYPRLIKKMKS